MPQKETFESTNANPIVSGINKVKDGASRMLEGDGTLAHVGRLQRDALVLAAQVEFGALGLEGVNKLVEGVLPGFMKEYYTKYARNPLGQVVLAAGLASVAVILRNNGIGTKHKVPGLDISWADFYCQMAGCAIKAATVNGAREAEIEKLLASVFPMEKIKEMAASFRKVQEAVEA